MKTPDSAFVSPSSDAEIRSEKRRLREQAKAMRAALNETERARASETVCVRLKQFFEECPYHAVAVYLATPEEVNIDGFIAWLLLRDKTVYAPREDRFGLLRSLAEVRVVRGAIREPQHDGPEGEPTIILVPGLLFDRNGGRVGFGGGWYDRALARFPQAYKIGVAFNEQIIEAVPREEHDILMDAVVVPGALFRCKNPRFE